MFTDNILYRREVESIASKPCEILKNKRVLVTGATGQIGTILIDTLGEYNRAHGYNMRITAAARNVAEAAARSCGGAGIEFIAADISKPLPAGISADIIIHAASAAHPKAFVSEPINTMAANFIGLYNIVGHAAVQKTGKILFVSTGEIYGENRGDTEYFDERYCGYLDCNTLRACYNESKRASESLCQAAIAQYGLDISIVRLPRVYGPTARPYDSKASAQFFFKALKNEDIVLKSDGEQMFSYLYGADAVSALLAVLDKGESGQAYNAADTDSHIRLKDFAKKIADAYGKKLVFELPDNDEKRGFSTATKALLNGEKLKRLGWSGAYSFDEGISRTIRILRDLYGGSIFE